MASQIETLMQSSEYMMRREKMQREVNRNVIRPISFEMYRKSESEKIALRKAKSMHNKLLKSEGFDPKRRLNISEPMRLIFNS